jgi:hypothetical protein
MLSFSTMRSSNISYMLLYQHLQLASSLIMSVWSSSVRSLETFLLHLIQSDTGDAFLKYLSSIYVFVTRPAQKEGSLHIYRQKIISNRSLLLNASRSGLPQYIQARPFSFRLWQPPNFSVQTNDHDSCIHRGQTQNEESIADVDMLPADVLELEKTNDAERVLSEKSAAPEESEIPAESSKPKRKSKKKQLEDQSSQWLGDKVHLGTQQRDCFPLIHITGCS